MRILVWLCLPGLLLAPAPLKAFKYDWTRQAEANALRQWQESVKNQPGFTVLSLENDWPAIKWKDWTKLSFMTRFRNVARQPEEKVHEAEKDLIKETGGKRPNSTALSVITDFNNPGRQNYLLGPARPYYLRGFLRRFSVWVRSDNYRHRLSLVLEDSFGRRHVLSLGTLNFKGWRRLEIQLPSEFATRNKRQTEQYRARFRGFYIQSHKREPRSTCVLLLDHMNFLADRSEWVYPGSQIKDDWGNFHNGRPLR